MLQEAVRSDPSLPKDIFQNRNRGKGVRPTGVEGEMRDDL